MRLIYVKIVCLLIIVALYGCNDAKKLSRICARTSLCDTTNIQVDTFFEVRQIETIDTQFITAPIDTIVLENEKVRTVIIRQHDTIKVTQTFTPDTVWTIKEKRIVKYRTRSTWRQRIGWVFYGVVFLLSLIILRKLIIR